MKADTRKQIQQCKKCSLHNNQPPLLDKKSKADVIWVGLSAVKVEDVSQTTPLSQCTRSGELISKIEDSINSIEFYKTNLVKCLPIEHDKIRYPNQREMSCCHEHLQRELKEYKPKIVFLLGKQVAEFVIGSKKILSFKPLRKDNITYVPIHHPSYMLVYKRKKIRSYVSKISKAIKEATVSF
ncbi:MAG TPA: uracil-DNA glycosylase family protein [Chitinophagales bacterium]|nr:uracil-DNA glycosylase family protein [Chitinophagales bacterium]